jgi:hypothetical protein
MVNWGLVRYERDLGGGKSSKAVRRRYVIA